MTLTMTDSTNDMRDCPKFEGCPAPICPLDPDWKLRVYRKGEPICFYLLEYVKPDAEAQSQGSIGVQIYATIESTSTPFPTAMHPSLGP